MKVEKLFATVTKINVDPYRLDSLGAMALPHLLAENTWLQHNKLLMLDASSLAASPQFTPVTISMVL